MESLNQLNTTKCIAKKGQDPYIVNFIIELASTTLSQ